MKTSLVAVTLLMLGATLAAAASNSPAAKSDQIVVDGTTRSKVLNDYTILTRDAIQRAWKKPLALNVPGAVKGRVRIDYCIKRSGEVAAVTVVQSSGNPAMDKSLVEAIRLAQPFPPFPDEIEARKVLVRANFIVADLPSAPVATVSQPTGGEQSPPTVEPGTGDKKLIWGRPAGTSDDKITAPAPAPAEPLPPQLPTKKYHWGR